MEAKQFYNRSINPLVTKTFACKWSDDNRLSIVTEKGVNVIEVVPALTQSSPIINLSRSFIYSPETLPGELYTNEVLSGIYDWNKEDVYSFLMQDALTPNFPKAMTMSSEIIDVFWSPQKLLHPHKCLIVLLTSGGAVDLAVQVDRNWISIYEFSSVWAERIRKELSDLRGNEKLDCDCLKEELYRLLATTCTWSSMYYGPNNACFAYLVTAHRNAEIVIWKVYRIKSDIVSIDVDVNVELKFNMKLIKENIKINTLLWVHLDENNYLLIVGFFNGQVGTLRLQEFEGGITSDSYSLCYPEEDSIPVDFFYVLRQTNKWLEIVVIKGMYLIVLVLDIYGKMISMKFISSLGFSITGAAIILDMILITTQDGGFHMIEKCRDQQELVCVPIKIDILKNHVQYLGLANSQNKLLFTLITSPSIMYDHLIERDPSYVYFFSLYSIPSLNPLNILYTNKEQSLLNCWDCLELIKINALKHNDMLQVLSRIAIDLESLTLHKLRIAYWIMTISETMKKKSFPGENIKPSEEIEQAKFYIFLHSASYHLSRLALKDDLNETQKLCMSLLRNHLDIWLAGEEEEAETPLTQRVKQVLVATSKFNITEQEKCSFCGDIITEPWASSCSIGHRLPRCAITCLQVTCTKFRSCNVCGEIFHPCLDVEMDEVRCLYCDLPVFYKNQIVDSLLQTSKKNLSRKRIVAGSNKESKEDEI